MNQREMTGIRNSLAWPGRTLLGFGLIALLTLGLLALDSEQAGAHHAVSVSGGDESGCAIDTGGELECWGSVVYGWTVLPAGRFKDVSTSDDHICAIRTGGELECWGDAGVVQHPLGRFSDLSIGGRAPNDYSDHACAIRAGGELECWAYHDYSGYLPQTDVPSGRFSLVSAGFNHTCAITTGAELKCWSRETYHSQALATDAPTGRFTDVSVGPATACAVTVDGELKCWGDAYGSGLNDAPEGRFTKVSVGASTACAIKVEGELECWGDDRFGWTDTPTGRFRQISVRAKIDIGEAGAHFFGEGVCAITARGELECWSKVSYSQANVPSGQVSQVSIGRDHTCAVTSGGELECWGDNEHEQTDAPSGRFNQVSAGDAYTCAITSGAELECWGEEYYRQEDAPAGRFTEISVSNLSACAIKTDGGLECWSIRYDPFSSFRWLPSPPAGRYTEVSAGLWHACAVTSGGAVECWGDNNYGQTDAPSGRFNQVSAGSWHTCAITSGGAVECWGRSTVRTDAPSGRFSQVSAGSGHTCAVTSGGAVECWGYNGHGQTDAPAGRFSQVSAGEYHTCAVTSSGAVECWGADSLYGTSFARGHAAQAQPSSLSARVVARRLDDGRIEFALQAPSERRILPGTRHFPRNAPVDRWLTASTISYHGERLGQIAARRLADGRTEFSFVTPEGQRLLPDTRRLPANPSEGWKRSSEIDIPLPGCRLSEPVEEGITFPTRKVMIDDSGDVYRVIGVPLNWSYTPEQVVGDNVRLPGKWVRTGSDVRYLVCGDAPPTDQERDRALFTAGYYYSTAPKVLGDYDVVEEGFRAAEIGYQAYLDHGEAVKWTERFTRATQVAALIFAAKTAHTALTADPLTTADVVKGGIDAADFLVSEGIDLYDELTDALAARRGVQEYVKDQALTRVEDALETGEEWRRQVDRTRNSNETLHFTDARRQQSLEATIAQGIASYELDVVLQQTEEDLWKKATSKIPLAGLGFRAAFPLEEVVPEEVQESLNTLHAWLEQYRPYQRLTSQLRNTSQLVAFRHEQLNERLGIHAGSLQ